MLVFGIFLLIGVSQAAPGARIVGGTNAEEHAWPWQLSLQYTGRHICGASLISEWYAITAAHCVSDANNPGNYIVVAGEHDLSRDSGTEQKLAITKITKHPQYNENGVGFPNDIAVLQLSLPAKLVENKVATVSLPTKDNYDRDECYITGWGLTQGGGSSLPNILQQTGTNALTHTECRNVLGFYSYLVHSSYHICAYDRGSGGCNGDSGGPMVCSVDNHWEVVGAASWVISGCNTDYPTAYVRVKTYVEWIQSIMN
uniref:Putative elastase-1-like protein n=1 Tax=Pinctada fucata TaxID=50426 RepID=A0A194ALG2_PINFU